MVKFTGLSLWVEERWMLCLKADVEKWFLIEEEAENGALCGG